MKYIVFIFCFALFAGGLFLMGFAFREPGLELPLFAAGLFGSVLAFAIPFTLMRSSE